MAQSTLSPELGFAAPSSFLPWLHRCNDGAADGRAPPSPARLDGGGAMAAMAGAADVLQVQA